MKTLGQMCMVVLFSSPLTSAFAQQQGKMKIKLNFNVAMPVGSFKSDYINKTSFNGATGEIGYWFNPKFALGLGLGYQSFYQKKDRQVYKQDGNQTISAVLSNTLETMPVIINGTFVPLAGSGSKLQPYLSAGAGVNLINYRQYFGEFSDGSGNSAFTAQAGAGFMLPVSKKVNGANLQVGASYSFTPYNRNGLSNLNTLGVNAGIVFPLR